MRAVAAVVRFCLRPQTCRKQPAPAGQIGPGLGLVVTGSAGVVRQRDRWGGPGARSTAAHYLQQRCQSQGRGSSAAGIVAATRILAQGEQTTHNPPIDIALGGGCAPYTASARCTAEGIAQFDWPTARGREEGTAYRLHTYTHTHDTCTYWTYVQPAISQPTVTRPPGHRSSTSDTRSS